MGRKGRARDARPIPGTARPAPYWSRPRGVGAARGAYGSPYRGWFMSNEGGQEDVEIAAGADGGGENA